MNNNTNKQTAKKLGLTVLVYIAIFLICTVLFIALFHIPYINQKGVFFYRGCAYMVVCAVVAFLLAKLAAKRFKNLELGWKDQLVVVLVFLGVTVGYFTLGPVCVERSFSVFMLSSMEEAYSAGDVEGMTPDEIEDLFFDKYFGEYQLLDKRFKEQMASGTIEAVPDGQDGEAYVITERGGMIVGIFRLVSRLFNMNPQLVYPSEYGSVGNAIEQGG